MTPSATFSRRGRGPRGGGTRGYSRCRLPKDLGACLLVLALLLLELSLLTLPDLLLCGWRWLLFVIVVAVVLDSQPLQSRDWVFRLDRFRWWLPAEKFHLGLKALGEGYVARGGYVE
jgi:hypothetical protein